MRLDGQIKESRKEATIAAVTHHALILGRVGCLTDAPGSSEAQVSIPGRVFGVPKPAILSQTCWRLSEATPQRKEDIISQDGGRERLSLMDGPATGPKRQQHQAAMELMEETELDGRQLYSLVLRE